MEVFDKLQENNKELISKGRINFKKSPKDRVTISYVETRLEALEEQWHAFCDTHRQIITEFNKNELEKSSYFVNSVYDNTEEIYFDYKTELKDALIKLQGKGKSVESVKESSEDSKSKYFVKLPEISIPKFSGKYTEWISFRDLFTSLIHNNVKLDDVQKLHYLKSHLSGEAEQLLRHVPITDKNYSVCWTQLTNRYDNKKYLSNNILRRFMSQKSLQKESCSDIKELLDNMNESLSALQNIGIEISNWDIIIIYIMSQRLDPESRKQWESKANESEGLPTLLCFKEFLEHKFRSLEFLDAKSIPKSPNVISRVNVSHVANNNGSSTSNQSNFCCPYCKANHRLINCKDFAKDDYNTRHNFVQTSRLCFNCLDAFHFVFSCRKSLRCRVCRRKHSFLLHPPVEENVETENVEKENVESSDNGVVVSSATTSGEVSNVVTCFSNVESQVLLATALVEIESRTGGSDLVLRCLLDQGSTASLITESAVQALGLKKIPNKVYISGVGDRDESLASMSIVEIKLKSIHNPQYTLVVKAHVLNTLTSVLPSRKVAVQLWPELTSLKLADPKFDIPNKIDLLLGAEVYGQILVEGIIKGPPGCPIAQNTQLGWILSGQVYSDRLKSETCQENCVIINMHTQSIENTMKKMPNIDEIRVVSDNSYPCSNYMNLSNDVLICPPLEYTLRYVDMRLSQDSISLVADINKMGRQVKMIWEDADKFQRILWRDGSENIQRHKVLRITFGNPSVPYLEARVRYQVAGDENEWNSAAGKRFLQEYYKDDLMTNCRRVGESLKIENRISKISKKEEFQLHKWESNSKEFTEKTGNGEERAKLGKGSGREAEAIKNVVRLTWNSGSVEFKYNFPLAPIQLPVTKVKVASGSSSLFNTLGWSTPKIIILKKQKLWISGIDWDKPFILFLVWLTYRLSRLKNFRIPWWIHTNADSKEVELHGFGDASNDAYAAATHIGIIDEKDAVHVNPTISKTKVSPNKTVTIPPLKMRGTRLLAKLLLVVLKIWKMPEEIDHDRTDSSEKFAWLSRHSSRWKTFISNRVSETVTVIVILIVLDRNQWARVLSKDNSEDCALKNKKEDDSLSFGSKVHLG